MTETPRHDAGRVDRWGLALLALLSYLPALASSPGKLVADTKAYLYLDPGRLLSDSLWSWDERQFAGWVPHQVIGYLWPSGPWFWTFERLGVPDWIAHRLWLATILFAAGAGARWCARHVGVTGWGALAAGVVYLLTPFVIPYLSRGSILLLPWAGLGWLVGLTYRAVQRGGWRDPLWFALVIATVGGINATAMVMIAPAPLLVILDAAARRTVSWRRAGGLIVGIGALSLAVSLWWMVGLAVQAAFGAPVLAYSETLEAVSFTSVSSEVLRGLGYWITYVTDPSGPLTSASKYYELSVVVMAAGFGLVLVGAVGLVALRWAGRRVAALLVLVGMVLAVGPHPFNDPPPLTAPLAAASRSTLSLALRSSTRAVPMIVLGLALGLGATVTALASRRRGPVRARVLAGGSMALALLNAPFVWRAELVDPVLRLEPVPDAWHDAAAALDELPDGYRTLQLPGTESAVARWGQTVDPILPGLTRRSVLQRDWLPTGSAAAMDLFYALDARFHTASVDPGSIAPIARLFGADSIVVAGDVAFDKFRTARPELTWSLYASPPSGLGPAVEFATRAINEPASPILDERSIGDGRIATPVPPVAVVPVTDPVPLVRATDRSVLVLGSGDGVVAAAGAGLLDPETTLRYAGSLDDDELAAAAADAELVVITDSNQRRAHGWWGSQDTDGFIERSDESPLVVDPADHRLPVFPESRTDDHTVAVANGPVTARATAYGQPTAYRPEDRPMLAVDGELSTAWRVADRADARGQILRLDLETVRQVDHVTVVQAASATGGTPRAITTVVIRTPAGERLETLSEASWTAAGQALAVDASTDWIELEVVDTDAGALATYAGFAPVGFAEVRVDELGPTVERVRVPVRTGLTADADTPIAVVLERVRVDPTDRWRHDPEPAMRRLVELPGTREFTLELRAGLDLRADDAALAELLGGAGVSSSSRLAGTPAAGAWAAFDASSSSMWVSSFDPGTTASLTVPIDSSTPLTTIVLEVPGDDRFSRITELTLATASGERVVAVPAGSGPQDLNFDPLGGEELTVTVTGIEPRFTTDRRTGERRVLPVAIAELGSPGITTVALADRIDTGCRDDLITIDGIGVPVRLTGPMTDALTGAPLTASACTTAPVTLDTGEHLVTTAPGRATGLAIDRVALLPTTRTERAPRPGPTAEVAEWGRGSRRLIIDDCPAGCWVTAGDGWNSGWEATLDGALLPPPSLVDGALSGWWIPGGAGPRELALHWAPQTWTWWGLGASAVAVLGVLLALVIGARHRGRVTAPRPALIGAAPSFATWPLDGRRRWLPVGFAAVVSALVIEPRWGLAAFVLTALAVTIRRTRLLGAAGIGLLAGVGIEYVVHQFRYRPGPGFGWVINVEPTHRWTLLAVVLLAAAAMAEDSGTEPLTSSAE